MGECDSFILRSNNAISATGKRLVSVLATVVANAECSSACASFGLSKAAFTAVARRGSAENLFSASSAGAARVATASLVSSAATLLRQRTAFGWIAYVFALARFELSSAS